MVQSQVLEEVTSELRPGGGVSRAEAPGRALQVEGTREENSSGKEGALGYMKTSSQVAWRNVVKTGEGLSGPEHAGLWV